MPHDGTTRDDNSPPKHGIDTEEVTGSNPVSPTFVKRRGVSSPMRPLRLRGQVDGHEIATAAGPR